MHVFFIFTRPCKDLCSYNKAPSLSFSLSLSFSHLVLFSSTSVMFLRGMRYSINWHQLCIDSFSQIFTFSHSLKCSRYRQPVFMHTRSNIMFFVLQDLSIFFNFASVVKTFKSVGWVLILLSSCDVSDNQNFASSTFCGLQLYWPLFVVFQFVYHVTRIWRTYYLMCCYRYIFIYLFDGCRNYYHVVYIYLYLMRKACQACTLCIIFQIVCLIDGGISRRRFMSIVFCFFLFLFVLFQVYIFCYL